MIKLTFEKSDKTKKPSKKTWLWEFSKKLVFSLAILYIVERLFSMGLYIYRGYENIDVFLQTGAEVFLATVVAYAVKAGFENITKIRKNKEDEENGMDNE